MTQSTRFQFDGNRLEAITWCQSSPATAVVADSCRVVDSRVVAFSHHRERFSKAVSNRAPELSPLVDTFIDQTLLVLPEDGEFFPRWECLDTGNGHTLQFLHREAPERLTDAILATSPHDPRTSPRTKGPDLERLMALRREVSDLGANEAVIVSPDGVVVEGAYSSLIVWPEPDKELWVVDSSLPRIDSVTERAVIELANSRGVTVRERTFRPEDLEGMVVWIVSALHGIRGVTAWVNGPAVRDDPVFRENWQDLLAATAASLPESSSP
jgi:hypothetical protein